MAAPWISVYEPLMGTSVEVRVWADDEQAAAAADAAVVGEIQRLTAVFSRFEPQSELSRWARGELDDVSADLMAGLWLAQRWFIDGERAFHPVCRVLQQRWERAVAEQVLPDPAELHSLAATLTQLPFQVKRRHETAYLERVGDCAGVDLNAVAKGYIVDCAVDRASALSGVRSLVVNAGGDLRHAVVRSNTDSITRSNPGSNPGSIMVGIEDPHRPYDNAEPLTRVPISAAALATSGSAHRGFQVGDQWFGHVLDPRTGWPVQHTASATAIAANAATADALATIAMVLSPQQALAFVERLDAAALLVAADGTLHRSSRWPD